MRARASERRPPFPHLLRRSAYYKTRVFSAPVEKTTLIDCSRRLASISANRAASNSRRRRALRTPRRRRLVATQYDAHDGGGGVDVQLAANSR